jgi:hypothetical protein
MKKFLFYFVLFFSIYVNAQRTIVEEKFDGKNFPIRYHFLPKSDKIVVEKGEYIAMSFNRKINNITSYDSNGKKEVLAENFECAESNFSITENTFQIDDFTKFRGAQTYKYVVNGKKTSPIRYADVDRNYDYINSISDINYVFGKKYFNDKYEVDIVNEKGKNKIDFQKDKIYLETLDLFSKKKKIAPITKPDLNRLLGNEYIELEKYFGYAINLIDNNKFEIVTKSITKDYKTTVLYRTFYDMEGKFINEIKYPVTLPTQYLIYSKNSAARIHERFVGLKNGALFFMTDINISDFIEDNETKDVYVYGFFGNKAKKLNDENSPSGYYVFKFDKDGNKVWESINTIDDKENFNKKIDLLRVFSSLAITNKGLFFEAGQSSEDYFHYSFLDKSSGKILTKNKISYKESKLFTMKNDVQLFIYSYLKHNSFKDKVFDTDGLVAIESNKKIEEYLKKIDSKKKLYFNTFFSVKGIWLIESDNKEYYKVTFFEN